MTFAPSALTPAEHHLLRAIEEGTPLDFSVGDDAIDDPLAADSWGPQRTLRGATLAALCIRNDLVRARHPKGLRVRGARVDGVLDLEGVSVATPLYFERCRFTDAIRLRDAHVRTLNFDGTRIHSLVAPRLKVTGALQLRRGFHAAGIVDVGDATIDGALDCTSAQLTNPGGTALNADSVTARAALLRWGFRAKGEVRLRWARLMGHLDCEGAEFENDDGIALSAERLVTGGSVLLRARLTDAGELRERFSARGMVRLYSARIDGNLDCDGADLANPGKAALDAERITVGSAVTLRARTNAKQEMLCPFSVNGTVRLFAAEIGTALDCSAAVLRGAEGVALMAAQVRTGGPVLLRSRSYEGRQKIGRFTASGEINFDSARIGGDLELIGASIENRRDAVALRARHITIGRSLLLQGLEGAEHALLVPSSVTGAVVLFGGTIGGLLNGEGVTIDAGSGLALNGEALTVTGAVLLRNRIRDDTRFEPCSVTGTVRLFRAMIGSSLDCEGARFENPGRAALNAQGIAVGGDVLLRRGFSAHGFVILDGARIASAFDCLGGTFAGEEATPPQGMGLSLRYATTRILNDDASRWPPDGKLFLEGFVYETLGPGATPSPRDRLTWLRRQPTLPFRPQPYEQLAAVLRRMGHEADARTVAIAKKDALRARGGLNGPAWVWNWLLGRLIGHGYAPWRAALLAFVFIAIGTFVFNDAHQLGLMVPPEAASASTSTPSRRPLNSRECTRSYPCFEPFMYSVDVFLPVIELQQKKYWLPNAEGPVGRLYRMYFWFHVIVGYVLTSLIVAALTGLVKKE